MLVLDKLVGRLALGAHGLVVLRAQVAQATGKLLRLGAGCGAAAALPRI